MSDTPLKDNNPSSEQSIPKRLADTMKSLDAMISRDANKPKEQAQTIVFKAAQWHTSQYFQNAIDTYQQALGLYQQLGSKRRVAHIYARMSHVFEDMGDINQAIEHCQKTIALEEYITIPAYITVQHNRLNSLKYKRGDVDATPPIEQTPSEIIQMLVQESLSVKTEKMGKSQHVQEMIEVQIQQWKPSIDSKNLGFEIEFLSVLRNLMVDDIPDMEEENPYYPMLLKLLSDIEVWWDDFTSKNSPPYFFDEED
jgi:tetratricopeptide (TPR) repeat protein